MAERLLNKENMAMAHRIAAYLRNVDNTSSYEKIMCQEAEAKNPDLRYKALEINKKYWKKRRYWEVGRLESWWKKRKFWYW